MNNKINKNSELFKFACQCLLLDKHQELKKDIQEKFVSGKVDLDRFILLCSNHLVLPAITLQLQNASLLELFPKEYSKHLKEIYELNKKRNQEILQQIEEISNQLKKANIDPLYLKGSANLMDGLYSDVGERMIGDIDFLVQEKDYIKTIELVKELNYHSDVKMYDGLTSWKHYPRLYREDVPADIEIHHVPVNFAYTKQFNTELLFKYKKEINQSINPFLNFIKNEINHLKDTPEQTTKTQNLKPET